MCPFYPFHFVLGYSVLLWLLWIVSGPSVVSALETAKKLNVRFLWNGTDVHKLELTEQQTKEFEFYIEDIGIPDVEYVLLEESADDTLKHLEVAEKVPVQRYNTPEQEQTITLHGKFNVSGSLLGFSKLRLIPSDGDDSELKERSIVNVEVHRGKRVQEIIFVHVVIILVLIASINMGCALDLGVVSATLRRPVGPVIGLATQYLIMPLLSFTLGYVLFRDSPEMWLGLFLTGCAPGGAGSNLWTYLLNGSLDLSVTMTFVSTLAAFAMIPLWVFALGRVIFSEAKFNRFPYRNLMTLLVGLIIAVTIGVLIRRFRPKIADFLKRMLKPVALVFIIFVMTYGVYVNLYMFSFFSWRVVVAGFCLPFFGYLFGGITALALKQDIPSVTAISIETGIQNTGLAIGIIKIALQDFSPLDDISMVMPVAVATMIPVPLTIVYITQCVRNRSRKLTKDAQRFDFVEQIA